MKPPLSIFCFLLSAFGLTAQVTNQSAPTNVLVNFYPANQPYLGLTNWPANSLPVSFSTNAPGWQTNMTLAAYEALTNSQWAVYLIGQEAVVENQQALVMSNYSAWNALYTNIPAGIADSSNRIAAMGVIYTNLLAGTNTQAQDNAQMTQMAKQLYYSYVYLNEMIIYLSRLGPGLQGIYNPTTDPVGP
jgi:hypothetical protein